MWGRESPPWSERCESFMYETNLNSKSSDSRVRYSDMNINEIKGDKSKIKFHISG